VQLLPENQQWLEEFRARYGRAPRILHIGNIANNAYNNAKLLNEAGLDCDVISYDYYHIMGCPEWEDADINGVIEDSFRPDWTKVDLGGFVRPPWFAQGPLEWCIRYLLARRADKDSQGKMWRALLLASRCATRKWVDTIDHGALKSGWLIRVTKQVLTDPARETVTNVSRFVTDRSSGNIALAISGLVLLFAFVCRVIAWPVILWHRRKERQAVSRIMDSYAREFSDRKDPLVFADIKPYLHFRSEWQKLLSHYDYVIAYSTDPILVLLAGVPYFAFEHGTLREIPYHETSQGRLTALAYRLARHVFVTNFDCVESASQLSPGRFTIINHPYDEDHGLNVSGWEHSRDSLRSILGSDFIFFHPTRHDWVEGTGYADKSNDIFLRAFASLRQSGLKVGLVCCNWGSNAENSRALLESLGCSSCVQWIEPLAITPFERMCLASDMVVDQFKLGAFGGVVFKAMAVGAPILTYLDEGRLLKQYPECPPVVNCRSEEEIMVSLQQLLSSPEKLKGIGEASRKWIKKFHSKQDTVNLQLTQFRTFAPISDNQEYRTN
jgi:glycosyltransferase involved in cell wall biosynthesis